MNCILYQTVLARHMTVVTSLTDVTRSFLLEMWSTNLQVKGRDELERNTEKWIEPADGQTQTPKKVGNEGKPFQNLPSYAREFVTNSRGRRLNRKPQNGYPRVSFGFITVVRIKENSSNDRPSPTTTREQKIKPSQRFDLGPQIEKLCNCTQVKMKTSLNLQEQEMCIKC